MNHKPSPTPTGLPGQSGFTAHIRVPLPTPPVELYADPTGSVWRLADDSQDGRYFVAEPVNPASCPRAIWAREDELVEHVGPLTRLERAA
ncbi:hypothetical protein ABZW02_25750 [Streptomyces sp. NPDC005180]|uniref:hypothetical protein n=1 Tax=Streptomyces sp. NPDC005180 TaxID=3156868 RepID=UPI0033A545CE